jgi:hypothetical protein
LPKISPEISPKFSPEISPKIAPMLQKPPHLFTLTVAEMFVFLSAYSEASTLFAYLRSTCGIGT